jgi:hypothetical protein
MLPVRGAREELDCACWRGSSRSSRFARCFELVMRTCGKGR